MEAVGNPAPRDSPAFAAVQGLFSRRTLVDPARVEPALCAELSLRTRASRPLPRNRVEVHGRPDCSDLARGVTGTAAGRELPKGWKEEGRRQGNGEGKGNVGKRWGTLGTGSFEVGPTPFGVGDLARWAPIASATDRRVASPGESRSQPAPAGRWDERGTRPNPDGGSEIARTRSAAARSAVGVGRSDLQRRSLIPLRARLGSGDRPCPVAGLTSQGGWGPVPGTPFTPRLRASPAPVPIRCPDITSPRPSCRSSA